MHSPLSFHGQSATTSKNLLYETKPFLPIKCYRHTNRNRVKESRDGYVDHRVYSKSQQDDHLDIFLVLPVLLSYSCVEDFVNRNHSTATLKSDIHL